MRAQLIMSHALCLESQVLAEDLYELLRSLDPARWRQDLELAIRERLERIRERLGAVLETYTTLPADARLARLRESLAALARVLDEHRPRADLPVARIRAEWHELQRRVQPSYAALAAGLHRYAIRVPALRPTNYRRSLFHIGAGLFSLFMIRHVLSWPGVIVASAIFAATGWALEVIRRQSPTCNRWLMALFRPVVHPHEHHRLNSSTWYASALALLAPVVTNLEGTLTVVVLAFADPAAGLVGRRFGRIRLRKARTLEGSLAFLVVGMVAGLVVLAAYYPAMSLGTAALLAASGTLFGAVAELYSDTLDDNFTVPIAVALGATLALRMLG